MIASQLNPAYSACHGPVIPSTRPLNKVADARRFCQGFLIGRIRHLGIQIFEFLWQSQHVTATTREVVQVERLFGRLHRGRHIAADWAVVADHADSIRRRKQRPWVPMLANCSSMKSNPMCFQNGACLPFQIGKFRVVRRQSLCFRSNSISQCRLNEIQEQILFT